jgi:hypothetical protein
MAAGCAGTSFTFMVRASAPLVPQALTAATVIVPGFEDVVTLIDVPEELPDHPEGSDHI